MIINEICDDGSPSFTAGSFFVAFLYAVITAAMVVALTELLHHYRKDIKHSATPPPTTASLVLCVKCESRSLLEVNETDQREYRLEKGRFTRSRHVVRGKVWHQHPTWHIPTLEREQIQVFSGIDDVLKILDRFDISPHRCNYYIH